MFNQRTFEYPAESLHVAHGLSIRINRLVYDLKQESVGDALLKLADPEFLGQISIELHRTVFGVGRLSHIEIHCLSLEVEGRYISVIDFSDSIHVHKFERRIFVSSLRRAMELHLK